MPAHSPNNRKQNRYLKQWYITVSEKDHGLPLHLVIPKHIPSISRDMVARYFSQGSVYLDQHRIFDSSRMVKTGETIRIPKTPNQVRCTFSVSSIDVLYEDPFIIVVNKPSGMASDDTLAGRVNTLPYILSQRYDRNQYLQTVHRLDMGTSGIMILSKKPATTRRLNEQFREHSVQKTYLAIVHGLLKNKDGRIESHLCRDPRDPRKFKSSQKDGKKSITIFRVRESHEDYSLVEVQLITGRTHQIRVHFAEQGNPILGDGLYGPPGIAARLMLHAFSISFVHPNSKKIMQLVAPEPEEFRRFFRE